jgi:hypothetical protein
MSTLFVYCRPVVAITGSIIVMDVGIFSGNEPLIKKKKLICLTLSLWGASCCVTYICYINILHNNYTYVIRKRNLTTYLLFQKFRYMFRPLQAIFKWYFWRFLTLLRYIHHLYKREAIYCFLICMYTLLRTFLKYTTFYSRITQNAYKIHIKFALSKIMIFSS